MSKSPPEDVPAPPYPGLPLGPAAAMYPPQQAGYQAGPQYFQYGSAQPQYPQPGPQANVVLQPPNTQTVTQVVVAEGRSYNVRMTCPHCHTCSVTRITHKSGLLTWLICGVLCFFLCWLCCFIPFCIDSCKDVEHHCSNCNNIIYIHKPL